MNKRGVTFFLIGAVVALVWGLILITLMAAAPFIILPKNEAAAVLMVVVWLAPGLAIGKVAIRHRSVTLKCRNCGWSREFAMQRWKNEHAER